ncbi:MAG: lysylphosphatidylglycerol synthase transmembrane domain-containing protein [Thermoleophilaceae bacterium]
MATLRAMAGRRALRASGMLLGAAVSILFTYLAVRGIDVHAFWHALRGSDYGWLIPALAVLAISIFLRIARWRVLFPASSRPSLRDASAASLLGYFFNNILPARGGEAVRVLALHDRAGTSRALGLATAVSERVYDILGLLVVLFASIPFLPHISWVVRAGVIAVALAIAIAAAVVTLEVYGARPVIWALRPLARFRRVSTERIEHAAHNVVEGLIGFRRVSVAVPAFLLTVGSWLVMAASFWLVSLGFHLGVGYGAAVLVVVTANFGAVLPASPGGIGVFEAAVVLALTSFHVPKSEALSYAVVVHALNFFPFLLVGYPLLHTSVVRRRRVRASFAQRAAEQS